MLRNIIIVSLLAYASLNAVVSPVYNFRIAQVTRPSMFEEKHDQNHTFVTLFFDQYQKKETGVCQNYIAGFESYIYTHQESYFRIDTAAGHVYEHGNGIKPISRTLTDDILFTCGRALFKQEHTMLTCSWLLGIPTHKIFTDISLGFGQVGIGVQCDGLYMVHDAYTIVYGGRYIYFVPRTTTDLLNNSYTFTVGNTGDILLALKYNWRHYGLEGGYTFHSQFGADAYPDHAALIESLPYIKHSFYGVYKYRFKVHDTQNKLYVYIGYGFERHKKRIYNIKDIVLVWASWSISF